jgi:hypothetical protein
MDSDGLEIAPLFKMPDIFRFSTTYPQFITVHRRDAENAKVKMDFPFC